MKAKTLFSAHADGHSETKRGIRTHHKVLFLAITVIMAVTLCKQAYEDYRKSIGFDKSLNVSLALNTAFNQDDPVKFAKVMAENSQLKYNSDLMVEYLDGALGAEHWKVAKLLIDNGVPLDCRNKGYRGGGPLLSFRTYASSLDTNPVIEIVNRILISEKNYKPMNKYGATALHTFCANGSVIGTEILIKRGWDVNARATNGQTPLMSAVTSGNDATVLLLLRNGADVELRNKKGESAYDLTTSIKNVYPKVKYLSRKVIDAIKPTKPALPVTNQRYNAGNTLPISQSMRIQNVK